MSRVLQEWDGYVVDISPETFTARLTDKTRGETLPTEDAEIPIAMLSDAEREFLQEGAFLHWSIDSDGISLIEFTKQVWTEADIRAADAEAAKLIEFFGAA